MNQINDSINKTTFLIITDIYSTNLDTLESVLFTKFELIFK